MATNLVDGTRAPHGGHHGPPPGGPPPSDGTGTTRAQANLSDLASRLGLDPQARPGDAPGSAGLRSRRKPRGVVRQMSNRILDATSVRVVRAVAERHGLPSAADTH